MARNSFGKLCRDHLDSEDVLAPDRDAMACLPLLRISTDAASPRASSVRVEETYVRECMVQGANIVLNQLR